MAEKNFGHFATYILFFPKILSGPVERAHNFLPQLKEGHTFEYDNVIEGFKRILWGLFKKLVVSNRLAIYTGAVFNNSVHHSGITLLTASLLYTIQLYSDFAGYTDMAIGSANILGFKLMENFNQPFFSKSMTEFWRKWHISLTTWVNEYIFNPIVIKYRNWNRWAVVYAGIVTFLILGFWHGANWTYLFFGLLQGIIISLEFLTRKRRKEVRSKIPGWLNYLTGAIFVFLYFTFSLIFFRADSFHDAFLIINKILRLKGPFYFGSPSILIYGLFGILILFLREFKKEYYKGSKSFFDSPFSIVRKLSYTAIIILILLFGVFDGGQFIYFKF